MASHFNLRFPDCPLCLSLCHGPFCEQLVHVHCTVVVGFLLDCLFYWVLHTVSMIFRNYKRIILAIDPLCVSMLPIMVLNSLYCRGALILLVHSILPIFFVGICTYTVCTYTILMLLQFFCFIRLDFLFCFL